jgi:POT family proton-dependent oligopeptide transporter
MMIILIGIVVTLVTGVPVLMQMLRKHPRGLLILFFAEMWERFSYYGMRGILIFYLTQHLLFDDSKAGAQYGSYTSLVYLLPLIGGLLADRYLGTRKAVAFGALLLVAGHMTMAVEGTPAKQTLVYAGQSYEVAIEGRMADRQVHLMVGGRPHEFMATADGGLEVKNMAPGGPLPAVMPKGTYELKNQVDMFGQNAFYLAVSLIIMGWAS